MLSQQKVAVAFGSIAALVHTVWSIVVLVGFGQTWVQFVTSMHFISIPVTVLPFDALTAVELIALAGIIGSILGYAFATIWNWAHK
jgi:hypothetical protein